MGSRISASRGLNQPQEVFYGYDAFDCDLALVTFWAAEYRYAVKTIPTKKNTPAIIMSPRSKARYAKKIQNIKRTTVTAIGMTNSLCSANKLVKSWHSGRRPTTQSAALCLRLRSPSQCSRVSARSSLLRQAGLFVHPCIGVRSVRQDFVSRRKDIPPERRPSSLHSPASLADRTRKQFRHRARLGPSRHVSH